MIPQLRRYLFMNYMENDNIPPIPESMLQAKREPADAIDRLATILSWALVPLMMPVYGILLIFGLSQLSAVPTGVKVIVSLIIVAINVVLPMMLVCLLKLFGLVDDIGLNNRKERLLPYIITILAFCGSGWYIASNGAPSWTVMFFFGGAAAAAVNAIVNFWWKISAHAAGIAGIVALLVRIRMEWMPSDAIFALTIIWVILAGMLGSARVWLGRHTVWQVMAGYAVGFLAVYLLTIF